jgi:hypothetical protein
VSGVGLAFFEQIAECVRDICFAGGIFASERRVTVCGWIGLPRRQATVSLARDVGGLWIYVIEIFQYKADGIIQAV